MVCSLDSITFPVCDTIYPFEAMLRNSHCSDVFISHDPVLVPLVEVVCLSLLQVGNGGLGCSFARESKAAFGRNHGIDARTRSKKWLLCVFVIAVLLSDSCGH